MKDKCWKKKTKRDGPLPNVTCEKLEVEAAIVPVITLFRFASRNDVVLMVTGLAAAIANGVCFPVMIVLFSEVTEVFVTSGLNRTVIYNMSCTVNLTTEGDSFVPATNHIAIMESVTGFAVKVLILSILVTVFATASVTILNYAAENQVFKIRSEFFRYVLRQDIGWFDLNSSQDFTGRLTEDLNKIQDGIGEKLAMLVYNLTCFVVCMTFAFVNGWEFTLVMMISTPILAASLSLLSKQQSLISAKASAAYDKANSVAYEVFSSIKTVMAFSGQNKEVNRFAEKHEYVRKCGIRRGVATALGVAWMLFVFYASFALAFWYSIRLSFNFCQTSYSISNIVTVFFCVLAGTVHIGQTNPYIEALAVARGAAGKIFEIIDQKPSIYRANGKRYATAEGCITFKNVQFSYPSRLEVPVLNGVNFNVKPGETVALVGVSGCGKSTCIQLIQRLYDPNDGAVLLDGNNIRQLNLAWLRSHIAVVGQEPVLFEATIGDNIRYGRCDATQEEIEQAAKEANAYDFILKLPKKFNTMVGERGGQLSGGQKQRIAIARALVRQPKILLLDEATSALDNQSEASVQKALDKARVGRTTIIVAQRLSTIRNVDRILVIADGIITEQGSYAELVAKQGIFFKMVKDQCKVAHTDDSEIDLMSQEHVTKANSAVRRETTEKQEETAPLLTTPDSELDKELSLSETAEKVTLGDILLSNRESWHLIASGIAAAVVVGLCPPAYAYLFSEVLGSLTPAYSDESRQHQIEIGNFYALMFLVVGCAGGLSAFIQSLSFSLSSESLTHKLRIQTFDSIVKQEVAWFDSTSAGDLCSLLSDDAASVQGATGPRLGILFQTMTTIIASVLLSLTNDWRLGLTATAFVPILFLTAYYQAKLLKTQSAYERSALMESARIATEAIGNIRTVASLGGEHLFHDKYVKSLVYPHKAAFRRAWIRGAVYGAAKSVSMLSYAATIYYGGWLVSTGSLEFTSVFKITESLLYGTQAVGQTLALAPDYHKAKLAAGSIYAILKRTPSIDSSSKDGGELTDNMKGHIEFLKVFFQYQNRKSLVLDGIEFEVKSHQNVAIVGPSGSGKTSAVQLLLRFYDYQSGAIQLDGNELKHLNTNSLRSNIGIVSQEPILFGTTLKENIEYGDNSRQVPMVEVIEAAKKANIHSFIQALPDGYETLVGDRGAQLSSGQKQRVAIARALVRNPKILLLDEATSALDTESEKAVQMALDLAREGRTCITIAHRLSTIQNADKIIVLNNGKVVENGTHEELIQLRGLYYSLLQAQTTDTTGVTDCRAR